MSDASALRIVDSADPTLRERVREHLETARFLFDNHWLGHAEQQCARAAALDPDAGPAADGLRAEIARRRAEPGALDLSRDHSPMAISKQQGTIISTLHFRPQTDARLKREAFRQAVTYIDVETSSQCNRRCGYCPNAFHDRLSSNRFMSDAVFSSFVEDLRLIDYAHELHFVGFNEPLMHAENILARIAQARRALPRASLIVFSNGDYLDRAYLDELVAAGMSALIVSVHLAPEKPYSEEAVFERINRLARGLEMMIRPVQYMPGAFINVQLVRDRLDVTVRQFDYQKYGSNRASSLKNVGPQIDMRTAACLLPIHQFVLGHQGKAMPCCTMMSDDPHNAGHVVGDLASGASVFDVYAGAALVAWRRSLFHVGPKRAPCDKCADNRGAPDLDNAALYEPWANFVSLEPQAPATMSYVCSGR